MWLKFLACVMFCLFGVSSLAGDDFFGELPPFGQGTMPIATVIDGKKVYVDSEGNVIAEVSEGKTATEKLIGDRPKETIITNKGRKIFVINGDGEKTPESEDKKPELEVIDGGLSDDSSNEITSSEGEPVNPSTWGDTVPGPQPTVPPDKRAMQELLVDQERPWLGLPGEIPLKDQSNRLSDQQEASNSDRPWINTPESIPLKNSIINVNRLMSVLELTQDQRFQVVIGTGLTLTMIFQMSRMVLMRAPGRMAMAIVPPEYMGLMTELLNEPELYRIPSSEQFQLEDVIGYLKDIQAQGVKQVDLNELDPQFARYLMDVVQAIEEQRFMKAYSQGQAA